MLWRWRGRIKSDNNNFKLISTDICILTLLLFGSSDHVLPRVEEHALVEHGVHVAVERVLLLEVCFVHGPCAVVHPTLSSIDLLFLQEFLVRRRREFVRDVVHPQEVKLRVCLWRYD